MRSKLAVVVLAVLWALLGGAALEAQDAPVSATYRGLQPVVKFDVSPPLRDIPPVPVKEGGEAMVDPDGPPGQLGPEGSGRFAHPLQQMAVSARLGLHALPHRLDDRARRFRRRAGVEYPERRQQLGAIQRPAELERPPRVRLRPHHPALQDGGPVDARWEAVLSPLDLQGDPLDHVVRRRRAAGGERARDDADGQRRRAECATPPPA